MPEQEAPKKTPGKKPGNPKMRQLREQNKELAVSNKKLRENLEDIRKRLKAQRNKAIAASAEKEELAAQLEELTAMVERKDAELAHKDNVIVMIQTESDRVKAEVHSYATSTSWKVTAPIRAVINLFK